MISVNIETPFCKRFITQFLFYDEVSRFYWLRNLSRCLPHLTVMSFQAKQWKRNQNEWNEWCKCKQHFITLINWKRYSNFSRLL